MVILLTFNKYCEKFGPVHDRHAISNNRRLNCWLSSLFKLKAKIAPKLIIAGGLWGKTIGNRWNPPTPYGQ